MVADRLAEPSGPHPPAWKIDARTELVIAVEIAKRLGISSQRVYVLAAAPGFPKPLGTLGRSACGAGAASSGGRAKPAGCRSTPPPHKTAHLPPSPRRRTGTRLPTLAREEHFSRRRGPGVRAKRCSAESGRDVHQPLGSSHALLPDR
jgi:hypothetical protein